MLSIGTIKDGDWGSVRQAIQKLSYVLGTESTPTFAGLTITGLTDNSLIYSLSDTLTSLGAATNGQIPIGSTGNAPVLNDITGTANQVIVTNAAGSITLTTPQDIDTAANVNFNSGTFVGLIKAARLLVGGVDE
jgi:hypothetical protein